jgi:hypothetical protein
MHMYELRVSSERTTDFSHSFHTARSSGSFALSRLILSTAERARSARHRKRAMVLIDDQQPQPTIPRWIAEVASFEREADGTVRRGHKWLQRLERAREQRWLSSLGPEERVHASQLPVERRQLLAALHRLESTMAPSARAILRRSTLHERLDVLCYERLRGALDADAHSAMISLDECRRQALLRPAPAALAAVLEATDAPPPPPPPPGGGYGSVSQAEEEEAAYAAAAAKVAEQRAKLSGEVIEADERRGALDWEAACEALAEEWQLMIEVSAADER